MHTNNKYERGKIVFIALGGKSNNHDFEFLKYSRIKE
jgi:hypothetical protein